MPEVIEAAPTTADRDLAMALELCQSIVRSRGDSWLTGEEAARLACCFGVCLTPAVPVRTSAEAAETAAVEGFPVVARAVTHKPGRYRSFDDIKVGLRTSAEVVRAFHRLAARRAGATPWLPPVSIQPMVLGAVETAVGLARDSTGRALIGLGPRLDRRFRTTPLRVTDALALIRDSRQAPLLVAGGGQPASDVNALADLLTRVSRIGIAIPEILELELDPVLVSPAGRGCHVADFRARVANPAPNAN